jgi:alpha-tubulin suppressor-like RCC1 family protein
VLQADAGGGHTGVVLDNGKVRCWGRGGNGQLGFGTVVFGGNGSLGDAPGELPTLTDVPVGGDVSQITTGTSLGGAGTVQTCALRSTGTVRCWGSGANGRLGYGFATFGSNANAGDEATDTPTLLGDVPVF